MLSGPDSPSLPRYANLKVLPKTKTTNIVRSDIQVKLMKTTRYKMRLTAHYKQS